MANALAVPGVLKDFLYPSASSTKDDSSLKDDVSSSGDEDQTLGWLQGKSKSGMKLVYGLLGGNIMTGSPSTAFEIEQDEDDEEDDEEEEDEVGPRSGIFQSDEAEILDDRTMTNFRKYFVLSETEKLLTG